MASAQARFCDVSEEAWYFEAIQAMEDQGLVKGYPDGDFRPQEKISAAEFVSITGRIVSLEPAPAATDHWASATMEAARLAQWTDWDEIPPSGESFDSPLSRQLAVKILVRALFPNARGDYLQVSEQMRDFTELDGRYYEPVFAAYALGLVTGDHEGYFHPQEGLSRAEACTLFLRALALSPQNESETQELSNSVDSSVAGGVGENGRLQVIGTQLCNAAGQHVVLHGCSTHGLQWYGQFASLQSIQNTVAYGANLFRIAMYTEEGGYLQQPEAMRDQLFAAVDAAIAADVYVIVDWHILSDGNPMQHVDEAEAFFAQVAERYADEPAVLYEICNEPNGDISWAEDVKPYAQRLIAIIRERSPHSLILLGSPTWSQDIHIAAADPIAAENVLYTVHFYAGSHGQWLQQRMDQALSQGLPLFVSEWGCSKADGSGGVYEQETKQWLSFLEERGISWANWSLCDKSESSAALKPGTRADATWTWEDLTVSGQLVFSAF